MAYLAITVEKLLSDGKQSQRFSCTAFRSIWHAHFAMRLMSSFYLYSILLTLALFVNDVKLWGQTQPTAAIVTSPAKKSLATDLKVAPQPSAAQQISWLTDYGAAMKQAEHDKKYLLVLFEPASDRGGYAADVQRQLQDPRHAKSLGKFLLLKQSLEQTIPSGGKKIRLISHASFGEMQGQAGLAVIDLANPDTTHYRQVVSQVPFSSGKYYRYEKSAVPALLSLPPGTLTQRSLIFAVRTHPERPASAWGAHDTVLGDEAASHSQYQASIQNQGHHHWGQRFERIRGRLAQRRGHAGLPREVVAESWPQQNLLDSCADCVQSWRQSDGHWGAVRAQHASYSYDIRRGNNGIWYATGLFSD